MWPSQQQDNGASQQSLPPRENIWGDVLSHGLPAWAPHRDEVIPHPISASSGAIGTSRERRERELRDEPSVDHLLTSMEKLVSDEGSLPSQMVTPPESGEFQQSGTGTSFSVDQLIAAHSLAILQLTQQQQQQMQAELLESLATGSTDTLIAAQMALSSLAVSGSQEHIASTSYQLHNQQLAQLEPSCGADMSAPHPLNNLASVNRLPDGWGSHRITSLSEQQRQQQQQRNYEAGLSNLTPHLPGYAAPSSSLGFNSQHYPPLYSQQFTSIDHGGSHSNMPLSFSSAGPSRSHSVSQIQHFYRDPSQIQHQHQQPRRMQQTPRTSAGASQERGFKGSSSRSKRGSFNSQIRGSNGEIKFTPPPGAGPDWDPRKIAQEQMRKNKQLESEGTGVYIPGTLEPTDTGTDGTGVFLPSFKE